MTIDVEKHAANLEKAANAMELDGIRADAATLRSLAADLRASTFEAFRAVAGDQVHVLAASKGRALTLVEVVNAAKDDFAGHDQACELANPMFQTRLGYSRRFAAYDSYGRRRIFCRLWIDIGENECQG